MTESDSELTSAVQRLVEWMAKAERAVVFTGAGMSTESGLPDFRSAGGLWRQNRRFEELASIDAFSREPEEFAEFYRWRIERLARHAPHAGHVALAEFEAKGRIQALITQNVDGFHEAAGSRNVLCLHGSLRQVRCQRCGDTRSSDTYLVPSGEHCQRCPGRMRPCVVLFGEALDAEVLNTAALLSRDSDLFMVFGSSLAVSPANSLPELALRGGARLVIVNQEPTPLDGRADLVLRTKIGPLLALVRHELGAP
ncbi:MAG TPA: NAD-dependent deacylase [Polyangiaceae bacterium]|nr:NAD-dependent deacylase [Polyangiaceae bacterium]